MINGRFGGLYAHLLLSVSAKIVTLCIFDMPTYICTYFRGRDKLMTLPVIYGVYIASM